MRVLFLTSGGLNSASSRTRVYEYIPFFKKSGDVTDFIVFNPDIIHKILKYIDYNLHKENITYIDIKEYIEDFYRSDVQESPESYFSDDDFQLTEEQEERKEQLETYISEMEDMKSELEDEQNELDSDGDEYSEIQEKLDEIDENIEKAQDELDSIEPETEPTDEMIEEKVQEFVDDRMGDPIGFLREFGLDLGEYIDKDALAQGLVDADGYGVMNSYDGTYDTIDFNGETYYIMRVA